MKTKQCNKCKQEKTLSQFSRDYRSKSGYVAKCKECYNQYRRKYYKANEKDQRESINARKKLFRARNKKYIDDWKSDKGCKYCPESEPVVLDCHHTGDKEHAISNMIDNCCSIEKIQKELDKCDCVCSNCHRRLHAGLLKGQL